MRVLLTCLSIVSVVALQSAGPAQARTTTSQGAGRDRDRRVLTAYVEG